MTENDYRHIEELMVRLLTLLSADFIASEKGEIQEFIDVGEYGLALETLVDIVIEENKQISGKVVSFIYRLAELMQLDKENLERKLSGHITDNLCKPSNLS